MHKRAFSTLEIKSVDDDQRIIHGIASTIETDRMGDIVEPEGATFKLPIPLLWQHNSREPIGEVFEAKVSKSGITIKARILKIAEPGTLKDRLDEAWLSVKHQLVRGLSIGFDSLETARIEGTYGLRFIKWEWLELSAVTIPANADATIQVIRAASGHIRRSTSGDSDTGTRRGAGSMKKTIAERKMALTGEKAAKVAKLNELMGADEGQTLDASQQEEFDTLTSEIKSIDGQLSRLETLDQLNVGEATPVAGATADDAARTRGAKTAVITIKSNLPPGFGFARAVIAKAAAFSAFQRGEMASALDIAKQRWPDDHRVQQFLKTAVAGATTLDSTWAAPLLSDAQTLAGEFLDFLRPRTIIGQFGTTVNGVVIPSLRRVPFNIRIQAQSVGGSASWVGQGKPKPLTQFGYTTVTLGFTKIAAITVITDELARFSTPNAESLVRDQLAEVVIARMDSDFIDPDISETSNVRPASITNGLVALTSAGTSAANVLTDLQNLLEPFILAKVPITDVVIIMPETLALVLSLMQNSLGQREFPELSVNGGRLRGIPVITSQYAANEATFGNMVIAVNARDIALADDGQVTVDASREASLQMDDAPSNDASTGTGQSMVSMFQTNSIALRAERTIAWKKLRTSAVVFMDDVNWGSIGSPV